MNETRVRPFSCGTQYADWDASNCARCVKGASNPGEPSAVKCEVQAAIFAAEDGDGTVTAEMSHRMGCDDPRARYNWPCREVEWTEEWKRECAAHHAATGEW